MDTDGSSGTGSPASSLTGLDLDGGWKVVRRLDKRPSATGGCFSESYIVTRAGQDAFLKALDFSSALRLPDIANALQQMTSAYLHERRLLEMCASARLAHVVVALDSGEIEVPGHGDLSRVPYLILERAEHDVRKLLETSEQIDTAWALRCLHHVAVGLWELHMHRIYHQDTKPSNVLIFADGRRKVSDLGRATRYGYGANHDNMAVAGDPVYAPPELLYGFLMSQERDRRMACDMYHLGSMIASLFGGLGMTAAMGAELHTSLYPGHWAGGFGQVLPHVRDAFDRAAEKITVRIPERFRDRLSTLILELCEPDPSLRGDPRARARTGNPYSLERYISRFNLLAYEAEFVFKKPLSR